MNHSQSQLLERQDEARPGQPDNSAGSAPVTHVPVGWLLSRRSVVQALPEPAIIPQQAQIQESNLKTGCNCPGNELVCLPETMCSRGGSREWLDAPSAGAISTTWPA